MRNGEGAVGAAFFGGAVGPMVHGPVRPVVVATLQRLPAFDVALAQKICAQDFCLPSRRSKPWDRGAAANDKGVAHGQGRPRDIELGLRSRGG